MHKVNVLMIYLLATNQSEFKHIQDIPELANQI
jgi:hypothetical protein